MTRKEAVKSARKVEPARRKFLKTAAAAGGAATIGFPMIAKAAETTTFKFQSTWPTKDIFHEYALDFAKKVNDMTGGRLKIEVLPAGAVVKAFDLIDAVNKGTLDGGHGVAAYWYGKNSAYSLFGTGPSFGMDANMLLSWFEYGGGKQFYEDLHQNVMKFDVVGFIYGPMPTQPLGWFKKQVDLVSRLQRSEVPDRGTVGGRVQGDGRGGRLAARRGDRAGARPRAGRRGRVQQCVLRPPARLPRRVEDLHAAELSPAARVLRDHVQQEALRRAAGGHQGHHRQRRPGVERRHVLEGDRPLLEGLRRR